MCYCSLCLNLFWSQRFCRSLQASRFGVKNKLTAFKLSQSYSCLSNCHPRLGLSPMNYFDQVSRGKHLTSLQIIYPLQSLFCHQTATWALKLNFWVMEWPDCTHRPHRHQKTISLACPDWFVDFGFSYERHPMFCFQNHLLHYHHHMHICFAL